MARAPVLTLDFTDFMDNESVNWTVILDHQNMFFLLCWCLYSTKKWATGGHRSVVVNCIYLDLFIFPLFVVCLCSAHLGGHRSVAAQGLPVNLQPWPAAASPCVASDYISPRGASVACVCAWLCLCCLALCGNELYLVRRPKQRQLPYVITQKHHNTCLYVAIVHQGNSWTCLMISHC